MLGILHPPGARRGLCRFSGAAVPRILEESRVVVVPAGGGIECSNALLGGWVVHWVAGWACVYGR